jgi:uncharacterized protein (TIGR03083 family)
MVRTVMNDDQIWAAIDVHRERTADLLESLTDDDWRHQSLCDGWTVADVAAHLTQQQLRIGDGLRAVLRHPGGVNRVIRETARRRSDLPPKQIISEIRAMVGSRRHNFGVTYQETLIDILVHSQDIAMPLGRRLEVDPDVACVAALRVWSYRGRGKARVFKKVPFDGVRFVATDIAWSVGDGPSTVEGPIVAILLVMTGRLVALPILIGDTAALTRVN